MMLSTRTRPKSGGSGGAGGGHEDEERIQLFRPSAGTEDVDAFLDRVELTDDEIISFLKGEPMEFEASGGSGQECDENDTVHAALKHAFHARRAEIRQLSDKLAVGEARIDEDGRLRPTEVPQHPNANLPPGPQPRNNNNDNNGNDDPPLNHGLFGGPVGDRQEAEVERMVEQETREAAASIARAVQRYRDAGVPEEDFEVILIEPRGRATANLTFRRICIAVLAVVTAFVCVILQTLPLLDSNFDKFDPDFDKLMYDLLHVRFIKDHAKNCPGLNRLPEVVVPNKSFDMQQSAPWFYFAHVKNHVSDRLKEFFSSADLACDDGVLHFPAKQVLLGSYLHSANAEEAALTKPFASGVNVSWFFPCQPLPGEELLPKASPVCMNSIEQHQSHEEELLPQKPSNCFRGVHDDIVSDEEIDSALRLGNNLIVDGGDHFTIHYDVSHLQQRIPTLLEKLQALLHENYHVAHNAINPVAFRVYTVGPMDAHGVNLYRSPSWTLNRTVSSNRNQSLS